MKLLITIFSIFAFMNLSVAQFCFGAEAQKKPLQLNEMAALNQQQAADQEELQGTTAGLANGYGLLTLLLVAGVAYLIYDNLEDDDKD